MGARFFYHYTGSHAEWKGAGVANMGPCGRIPGIGQCPCGRLEALLVQADGRTMMARHMRRESIATGAPPAATEPSGARPAAGAMHGQWGL